jgi:hypothetical protein
MNDEVRRLTHPTCLAYGPVVRSDLKLLEVDEGLLSEILDGGCGKKLG